MKTIGLGLQPNATDSFKFKAKVRNWDGVGKQKLKRIGTQADGSWEIVGGLEDDIWEKFGGGGAQLGDKWRTNSGKQLGTVEINWVTVWRGQRMRRGSKVPQTLPHAWGREAKSRHHPLRPEVGKQIGTRCKTKWERCGGQGGRQSAMGNTVGQTQWKTKWVSRRWKTQGKTAENAMGDTVEDTMGDKAGELGDKVGDRRGRHCGKHSGDKVPVTLGMGGTSTRHSGGHWEKQTGGQAVHKVENKAGDTVGVKLGVK